MTDSSELMLLVLALALAPLVVWAYRGIDLPEKRWLALALCATLVAFASTVMEGFVASAFFNTLEHASFAVAGACFAMVAFGLLGLARGGRDDVDA